MFNAYQLRREAEYYEFKKFASLIILILLFSGSKSENLHWRNNGDIGA